MIFTNRLLIKYLEVSDVACVHDLLTLPETDEFNTLGIPDVIENTENWVNSWVIDNKRSDRRHIHFLFI